MSTIVTLRNDFIAAHLVPERGGRMVSLESTRTGREYLHLPRRPLEFLPAYGDDYATFDPSGFDECYPTVAPSVYRYSGEDVMLPDHGELWSGPWSCVCEQDRVVLSKRGIRLPYHFRKSLRIDGPTLYIDYAVENTGTTPFHQVWSAHPLLALEPHTHIELPPEVQRVVLEWAADPGAVRNYAARNNTVEKGEALPWPQLFGPEGPDFSYAQGPALRQAIKAFTPALMEGWAQLRFMETDEALRLEFDPDTTPYLGLWLCAGGWPVGEKPGHYTLAIEPTDTPADSLGEAAARGLCPILEPGESRRWWLSLTLV